MENEKIDDLTKDRTYFKGYKKPAIAGLIVLTPFIANLLFLKWALDIFSMIPGDEFFYVTSHHLLNQALKAGAITGFTGIIVVVLGKVSSTSKGVTLENKIDVVFSKLPVVGPVYNITKKAADTVLTGQEDFKHPVKLSFGGLKFTAFQTGKCREKGKQTLFVPTSPNITSGFVVEVDEQQVERSDESLEEAFTKVLSAGFSN